MTDRERAQREAREILPYGVTIERRESLRQVIADALLQAEARGVEWAHKLFDYDQLKTRAAELRAQMSEPKRRAEGGQG